MRKQKLRLYVAPIDEGIELRDDDLLQVEHVAEEWIYENQCRGESKKLLLVHTREFTGWPAELTGYYSIRLIDLDELGRVSEFYNRGYRLIVYRDHPALQRLLLVIAECVEL